MGKSGCGKSTLEKGLIEKWPNQFKKVVSSTTRPPREGEVDGKHYYFISEDRYDIEDFVQTTTFAGYRYGSTLSEYVMDYPILCVVPSSAKQFTEVIERRFPDWTTFNIYFDISDERLMENMRKRGDTEEMIVERIAQDTLDKQFEESGLMADFVVTDEMLNETLPNQVAAELWFFEQRHEIRRLSRIAHC